MKRTKRIYVWVLLTALLCSMIPSVQPAAAKKPTLSSKKLTITKGASKVLKVKNTKKKVKWSVVSGKKNIILKKKGVKAATITGKLAGTAKVRATVGKQKLTCKVTVKNKTDGTEKEGPKTPSASTDPLQGTEAPPVATKMPQGTTIPPSVTNAPADTTLPPTVTNVPSTTDNYNEDDVAALKKLIAEQRALGADISEDINDTWDYSWNEEGRLKEICWNYNRNLKGNISFSAFTALQSLTCDGSQLTSLDVSGCTELTGLECSYTQISSLDVSHNTALVFLACNGNQLSGLELSQNTALEWLECENNLLNSLDVSSNIALTHLLCKDNQLTSLNVSFNKMLEYLDCNNNQLGSLDVKGCTKLAILECENNQLINLNINHNTNLQSLLCDNNKLTSLDVSQNQLLTYLVCDPDVTVIGYNREIDY